jgi:hypothetical protein
MTLQQKSPQRELCPQFHLILAHAIKKLTIAMLDCSGSYSDMSDLLTDLSVTLKVRTEGNKKRSSVKGL